MQEGTCREACREACRKHARHTDLQGLLLGLEVPQSHPQQLQDLRPRQQVFGGGHRALVLMDQGLREVVRELERPRPLARSTRFELREEALPAVVVRNALVDGERRIRFLDSMHACMRVHVHVQVQVQRQVLVEVIG